MARIKLDNEATPATPAAGISTIFPDSTSKELVHLDDTGKAKTLRPLTTANTGNIPANAADTYLVGQLVPPAKLRAGTLVKFTFGMTKTAAGTATPVWSVRVGTAGTTADTAQLTFTGRAQQANADTARAEIHVIVRSIGASGVIEGIYALANGAAAGFTAAGGDAQQNTSAGFDTTVANLIVGVSVNPGAAGNWTVTHAAVEMVNV